MDIESANRHTPIKESPIINTLGDFAFTVIAGLKNVKGDEVKVTKSFNQRYNRPSDGSKFPEWHTVPKYFTEEEVLRFNTMTKVAWWQIFWF